jgi:hypothetical protein
MEANQLWGKSYLEIKAELERQLNEGIFDTSIASVEEARRWIIWAEKLRKKPEVLRLGDTIIELDEAELEFDGQVYKKITIDQAKKLKNEKQLYKNKNKLNVINVVQKKVLDGGLMQTIPIKKFAKIIEGNEYFVFNPNTGQHELYKDKKSLLERINELYNIYLDRQKLKNRCQRKIVDPDGLEALEDIK